MSGVRFEFDSSPLRLHLARLALMNAQGFTSVRREIGNYLVEDVKDNLRDQTLFDGSAMPQSKAAQGRTTTWGRSNKKLGRTKGDVRESGKTLLDQAHLRNSYTFDLDGAGVAIGSNLAYAAIHHFGGETGRTGHRFQMIARPLLGIGPRQEGAIGDFLLAEIRRLQ